ncbi:MAG: hypothetical protein GX115_08985 [Ruminiclostridium sp.]|nr:hypothetical protein [Ruminiclostridium sp.]
MSEVIEYKSEIIINTLKSEVLTNMGNHTWDTLTDGIGIPDINSESKCDFSTMREFMRRFDGMADTATAKKILTRVRHGLKRSQFNWAREKFDKCGSNIDTFIRIITWRMLKHSPVYAIQAEIFTVS